MSSPPQVASQKHVNHSTFDALELGESSQLIHARLLRFWDSQTIDTPADLTGITLLFIDEKDSMINGFIPADCANRFRSSLKERTIFNVAGFVVQRCPHLYKTTEHPFAIRFTSKTSFEEAFDHGPPISFQKFMLRKHDHLQILANTNLELSDVVGEILSVKGYRLTDTEVTSPILIRFLIARTMEVYLCLLDDAATVFKTLLNSGDRTHSVMVVTSVDPQKIGDDLYLITTAATKLFSGLDLHATTEFTKSSNKVEQNIPTHHAGRIVTNDQISSIGDLSMFLSNSTAKEAYFSSTARIVEVLGKNGWFYVSCNQCGIKLHNSAAYLPCSHCLDTNARGVAKYRVEMLVDDGYNYATFLVLNKEMFNLTTQAAATTIHDEVTRGVCGRLPPPLAALEGKVFVFHVLLTATNVNENSPTFTVVRISDTTNPKAYTISGTKCFKLPYGEASTSNACTLPDGVVEGKHSEPNE